MKRLIVLVVLAGVFLGGYHVGQCPGAPDMSVLMGKTSRYVQRASEQLTRAVEWGREALREQGGTSRRT